ncbi:MAG: flagellar basal body protein [Caulobacteraceae bacterium]|nr:flagellar basal body protein [Caulobacteraceae bacterium]
MDNASNPAQHIEQLIVLTEQLTRMIADQAKAFEARRPQDAAASMEETNRLANIYRQEAARVRENPQRLAQAPAALRAKLVRATEAFDAVIARHGRALKAAKTVTEGLVHAIAAEVANQRSIGAVYGPSSAKVRQDAATAITLNRRA